MRSMTGMSSDDARALLADEAAQAEDDGALVLAQDAERGPGGGDREQR